jgi:deoxyribose-phosphate aldolase
MENSVIYSHVDHTLLKATASWNEIQVIVNEAITYQTASICVPPSYVSRIHDTFPNVNICTVIGFPLGYSQVKVTEAELAVREGASEIDMVINLGDVKNGDFSKIQSEIAAIRKAIGTNILKVIVETCYLTQEEKVKMCHVTESGGADYIKTSTGFGSGGATLEDIVLFRETLGGRIKIKAAGGIKTREDMIEFLSAGADRLGTSSAVKILSGQSGTGY